MQIIFVEHFLLRERNRLCKLTGKKNDGTYPKTCILRPALALLHRHKAEARYDCSHVPVSILQNDGESYKYLTFVIDNLHER